MVRKAVYGFISNPKEIQPTAKEGLNRGWDFPEPKPILDFQERPNTQVYVLNDGEIPTLKYPAEIQIITRTEKSIKYVCPKNWTDFSKKYPSMPIQTFLKKYFPMINVKEMKLFPLCLECGYNRIWKGRCITCDM